MRPETMSADPIGTAARRARRERRFGSGAACVRCGIAEPETLIATRRTLLEAHHVCGRANDDGLAVPVCRNCHAILTESQQAAGVRFTPPPTSLHQIAAALVSLFAFIVELGERGMNWARALFDLASELDAAYPAWRDLPSARTLGMSP